MAPAGPRRRWPRRCGRGGGGARPGAARRRWPPATGRGGSGSPRSRPSAGWHRPRSAADRRSPHRPARPAAAGADRRPAPRVRRPGASETGRRRPGWPPDPTRCRAATRTAAQAERRRRPTTPRRRTGCPPSAASAHRAHRNGWALPVMASAWRASWSREKGGRARRVLPDRSSSASSGRRGWRRCSSSLRTVPTSSTRPARLRSRNESRSRVDRVGPVQVLGHDHRGPVGAHPLEQRQQQLEQSARRRPRRHRVGIGGGIRDQELELGGHRTYQLVELVGLELISESSEGLGDGGHGHAALAQLQAPADQHQEARVAGPVGQLIDQAASCPPPPPR